MQILFLKLPCKKNYRKTGWGCTHLCCHQLPVAHRPLLPQASAPDPWWAESLECDNWEMELWKREDRNPEASPNCTHVYTVKYLVEHSAAMSHALRQCVPYAWVRYYITNDHLGWFFCFIQMEIHRKRVPSSLLSFKGLWAGQTWGW
jgi:hypothetical protein